MLDINQDNIVALDERSKPCSFLFNDNLCDTNQDLLQTDESGMVSSSSNATYTSPSIPLPEEAPQIDHGDQGMIETFADRVVTSEICPPLIAKFCDSKLIPTSNGTSQLDVQFVSIQDVTNMETPFVSVPQIDDSAMESSLLLPNTLLNGIRLDTAAFSEPGVHSCISSVLSLASSISTGLASRKFKSSDSDTGTDLLPVCRICQLPGDKDDFLFSPCRCAGTMMFVHYLCLLKWIDISTRKTKRQPTCELCHFQYVLHRRFKFHHWRWPRVSGRDKCLHTMFFTCILLMMICAVITVFSLISDNQRYLEHQHFQASGNSHTKPALVREEIITLSCGISFFLLFFVVMASEIRARHTVFGLFMKFLHYNTEWRIEPYRHSHDAAMLTGDRDQHGFL